MRPSGKERLGFLGDKTSDQIVLNLFTYSLLIDGKIWLEVYYTLLSQPLSTAEIRKACSTVSNRKDFSPAIFYLPDIRRIFLSLMV